MKIFGFTISRVKGVPVEGPAPEIVDLVEGPAPEILDLQERVASLEQRFDLKLKKKEEREALQEASQSEVDKVLLAGQQQPRNPWETLR